MKYVEYLNEAKKDPIDEFIEDNFDGSENYVKISERTLVLEFLKLYQIIQYERGETNILDLTKDEFEKIKRIKL